MSNLTENNFHWRSICCAGLLARRWSVVVCCLLVFVSCVDEVRLPIRQVERRLVVEGLITDEPPPYAIKLTYSGNLTGSLLIPSDLAINGAVVFLTDDAGHRARLEQDALNPAFYWMYDPALRGQVGRSYSLSILLPDGSRYSSRPERLNPTPPLENLRAEYVRATLPGQTDAYAIRVDTQDPPAPGNYYRWAALAYLRRWASFDPQNPPLTAFSPCQTCSCWVTYYGPQTDVLSDALINGNRIAGRLAYVAPLYGVGQQYVQVRQFSLTRQAFQYWELFDQQRSRSGSLFDAQPASIEGNVRDVADTTRRALGYFGASAVSQQRLTIPADTINYGRFVTRFKSLVIPPSGDCASNYDEVRFTPPDGFPPARR
jgi:hypothetical protein